MNPTDTLSGTYGTAETKMPDGTVVPVLVKKITNPDGGVGWQIIDDRVMAFEAANADTEFPAAPHSAPTTAVLTKKNDEEDAHLGAFLGDPRRIIERGGLDTEKLAHMKLHPASLTMARRLCNVVGGVWLQVLPLLPRPYPGGV
jgi:hypothetical protein